MFDGTIFRIISKIVSTGLNSPTEEVDSSRCSAPTSPGLMVALIMIPMMTAINVVTA